MLDIQYQFSYAFSLKKQCLIIWTQFLQEFQPDMTDNPFTTRFLGAVLDTVGCNQLKWRDRGWVKTPPINTWKLRK